jgi:hypothetical protein
MYLKDCIQIARLEHRLKPNLVLRVPMSHALKFAIANYYPLGRHVAVRKLKAVYLPG